MFLLDFILNVGHEQGSFLQLLVQNPDIRVDRITDFCQSDDFGRILLKLCIFFLVNIFDNLSGTQLIAMKLFFLLLSAFQNEDSMGELFALGLQGGQLSFERDADILDVIDMVLELLNLGPDLVNLISLN